MIDLIILFTAGLFIGFLISYVREIFIQRKFRNIENDYFYNYDLLSKLRYEERLNYEKEISELKDEIAKLKG